MKKSEFTGYFGIGWGFLIAKLTHWHVSWLVVIAPFAVAIILLCLSLWPTDKTEED